MTKQPITQSQKRFQDSLGSLFVPETSPACDLLFLKSSSDVGVERNGGRNGARYAPQSLLSYFKKMNKKPSLEGLSVIETEVANEAEERADFHQAQSLESQRIEAALNRLSAKFICHLGGGHDHIYPLLSALGKSYKKVIVVNVDAHADTRTDESFHSGTPFRQFARDFTGEFCLYQAGLLAFANSQSTLSSLGKTYTKTIWRHELADQAKLHSFFEDIEKQINPDSVVIFSLDADALNGADMPGVSAVNGNGISREELSRLWESYRKLPFKHSPTMGIYELNPVYDTLSMVSMRTLGAFLFECL